MSKVKCLICGNEYSIINRLHLAHHGISSDEYLSKFPNSKLFSDDYGVNRSRVASFVNKKRWTNNYSKECESIKKIRDSEGFRNQDRSKTTENLRNYMQSPKGRELKSKELKERWQDPSYQKYMSDVSVDTMRKNWKDPEFIDKVIIRNGISQEEIEFFNALDRCAPNRFDHCSGKKFISIPDKTLCPDILVIGQKKVIEYNSEYYHPGGKVEESQRISNFNKAGYSCFIIWDYEWYDNPESCILRCLDFAFNDIIVESDLTVLKVA